MLTAAYHFIRHLFRTEAKVIAFVIFIIVVLEAGLHLTEQSLSSNISHIRSISRISHRLRLSKGLRLLFLGNSLTGNGVDPVLLREDLHAVSIVPVTVEKVTPDGTDIWDWYFILKNNFLRDQKAPDFLLICFAWEQLNDATPFNSARLGGYFCRPGDVFEFSQIAMPNFKDQADFIFSSACLLFTTRETIRNRLLKEIIPHFQECTRKVNDILLLSNSNNDAQFHYSYKLLERLLQMFHHHGTKIVFVAMPVITPYTIQPKLLETLDLNNARFIDCRHIAGLRDEMFLDPIHLNGQGSHIFTRYLTQRLVPALMEHLR